MLKGQALTHEGKKAYIRNNNAIDSQSADAWIEGELYRAIRQNSRSALIQGNVEVELIPYYAWANRGLAYMDVWIPLAR